MSLSTETLQAMRVLLDEAECARLCAAFVSHIDTRAYAPLLELFTDDATLDRLGTVLVGREAISRYLQARPVDVVTRHLSTSLRVQFESADTATGRSVVLFCQGAAPSAAQAEGPAAMNAPPSVVEYQDRYQRTAAGWRISQRRIRLALQGHPKET